MKREAEKEANEKAKVERTMHDIESKAFASYAADLKEQEEKATPAVCSPQKQKTDMNTQIHKVCQMASGGGQ